MKSLTEIINEIERLEKELQKYPIGLLVQNPNHEEHYRIQDDIFELIRNAQSLQQEARDNAAIATYIKTKAMTKGWKDSYTASKSAATQARKNAERDGFILAIANDLEGQSINKKAAHIHTRWDDLIDGDFKKLSKDRIRRILAKEK